jgi:predicted nucleotide-binding protein
LTAPREEFQAEIDDRIRIGGELLERAKGSQSTTTYEALRSDYYIWNDYNKELLIRRFTTSEAADTYSWSAPILVGGMRGLHEKVEDLRGDVQGKIRRLQSLKERIPLIPEATTVRPHERRAMARREGADEAESIFIVHGHHEALKLAVHGFIRDVTELDPVILHDEPSMGRTIIEKFEAVGGGAAFAVVLLTSDDIGRSAEAEDDAPFEERARQNVVLELGFFVGSLGRSRVAVLYESGVTKPSDIDGLVYIPYDDQGAWTVLLARELRAAGITVDANKLL